MKPCFASTIHSRSILVIQSTYISKQISPQEITETQMIRSTTQKYSYKNDYNNIIQNIKKNKQISLHLPLKTFVAGVRETRERRLLCRMTFTITNRITAIYWLNLHCLTSVLFCMGAIVYARTDVDYSTVLINSCPRLYLM